MTELEKDKIKAFDIMKKKKVKVTLFLSCEHDVRNYNENVWEENELTYDEFRFLERMLLE